MIDGAVQQDRVVDQLEAVRPSIETASAPAQPAERILRRRTWRERDIRTAWYSVLFATLALTGAIAWFLALDDVGGPLVGARGFGPLTYFGFLAFSAYVFSLGIAARPWSHQAIVGEAIRVAIGVASVLTAGYLIALTFGNRGPQADAMQDWFLLWGAGAGIIVLLAGLIFSRVTTAAWAKGAFRRRIVLYGATENAAAFIDYVRAHRPSSAEVIAVLDNRTSRRPTEIRGVPVITSAAELLRLDREHGVDGLYLSITLCSVDRLKAILSEIAFLPISIGYCLNPNGLAAIESGDERDDDLPVVVVVGDPMGAASRIVKRAFDIVASGAILLAISPLLLATAVAIKLESRGPMLFRQQREGFKNQHFEVLKFRSMYTDMCDLGAEQQTRPGDARVTTVGRFIRKTSIDELPQLINVLKGDMSLVGPRPHALKMKTEDKLCHELVQDYVQRFRMKPGITGWAQVNGFRGPVHSREQLEGRVERDLEYIENWSLWLDIKILLRSVRVVFGEINAY